MAGIGFQQRSASGKLATTSVQLPQQVLDAIKQAAAERNVSRSAILSRLIQVGLEHEPLEVAP